MNNRNNNKKMIKGELYNSYSMQGTSNSHGDLIIRWMRDR